MKKRYGRVRKPIKHGPPIARRSVTDGGHELTCGIDAKGRIFKITGGRTDEGLDGVDEIPLAKRRRWYEELASGLHKDRKEWMAGEAPALQARMNI